MKSLLSIKEYFHRNVKKSNNLQKYKNFTKSGKPEI